jgi:hypothetical protein
MDLGLGSVSGWLFTIGTAALFLWGVWMGLMGLSAPHAPRDARPAPTPPEPATAALVVGRVAPLGAARAPHPS